VSHPVSRLRIVSVPYLNAAPLVWGFRHGSLRASVDLSVARPSRIASLLERGEADFGLLPIIETQLLEGCRTVGGMGIVSPRRARSVLLVSRRPLAGIRRIALDVSSRSSAALLRVVLLAQGIEGITFEEAEPDFPAMLEGRDAALLIGDPALCAVTRGFEVLDLAEAWHAQTGLPFVFAAWTARPGLALADDVLDLFHASRREGLDRLETIAREASTGLGLPAADLECYLTENIRYVIGSEEERAVALFLARAHETGLIGRPRPVTWIHAVAARSAGAAAGAAAGALAAGLTDAGIPGGKQA
jgi:predicted solute-binding protein